MTDATITPHQEQRERWIVWIVTAAVFVSVLNTTMVNVALPTIGEVFDAGPARVGWLATMYSLMFGIATPFYGRLGDRYGLRKMFVIGMSIFVASSLLAGIVPEFWMLILFRVGQALGSAAIPSLGIAMITRTIPGHRRGAAMGLVSASVGAGQALGPTLGGTLTEFASWRFVFLISAGLILLVPPALKRLPGDLETNRTPVDWLGGVVLALTIAGTLFGVGNIEERGLGSVTVAGAFGIAVLALLATIYRQRQAAYPFIERALLANRRYLMLCSIGFLAMGANVGGLILAPFLLERVNGLSTASVGLALLPQAAVLTVLSRSMGRLADRVNALHLISAGLLISVTVTLLMATVVVGRPTVVVAGLLVVLGTGQAMINSPLSVTLTRSIPQRFAGVGLGMYNMLFFVGGGFGAAAATTLLSAREDASSSLLPIYAGAGEFSEFGDGYLYSLFAFIAALVIARVVLRTTSEPE
jgi:DHA2 family metal-tetracycline-proton antiporter-like MFS transporter